MNAFRLLPLVIIACVGCSRTSSLPPPSQAELREHQRRMLNEEQAKRLFASGEIHAGQDVHEFLKLCKPYRADFVDQYTFVEFHPVPNLHGLTVIAIDGKLVSARRWSCTRSEAIFETIGEDEKQAALAAYEPRVWGDRR